MKTLLHPQKLPRLVLVLGVIGFGLRCALYSVAVDRKNLLVPHPLGFALGVLTLAAMVLVITGVLRWNKDPLFSVWRSNRTLLAILAALGFGSVLLKGSFAASLLILVRNILAILSALSMASLPVLEKKGKKIPFPLYALPCLFFAVHMVSSYQLWSSNPQIQDYVFTLMANVGLMLYTYQKAAAAVGFRKEKRTLAIGLLTVYFCYTALSGTDFFVLFLCTGSWVLADLSRVFPEKTEHQEENPL